MQLRLRFTIEPTGTVSNTSSTTVVRAGDSDAATVVAQCVERVVQALSFPVRPSGGPAAVSLPFVFSPSEGANAQSSDSGSNVPTGRVDPVQVSAILRAHTPAMRACYVRAQAIDRTLTGQVMVRFTVGTDGRVTHVSSQPVAGSGNSLGLQDVTRCIEGVIRPLVFPPPTGGPAALVLPVNLGP